MISLEGLINQVLIIYSMILIGVIASKVKILNSYVNLSLSKLLLNITLPLFIISSFNYDFSNKILKNMLIILLFGIFLHPICYIFGKLIYRKKDNKANIYNFSLIFTNCGYMAFPILDSIYGPIGVIYGSVFLIPFNIYLWTIGLALFQNKQGKNRFAFINPGIIAVIIGSLIFIFQIQLPYFLEQSIKNIGSITTPFSMLIIGGIISEMKFKEMFNNKQTYLITLFRLLIIPLIVFLILRLLPIDKIIINISVLLSAMPVAVTAPIFAKRYDGNAPLASQVVFISTLFSVITIPIIALVLNL